jgi:hypothetical protein
MVLSITCYCIWVFFVNFYYILICELLHEHLQEFAKSTWHPSIFGKTGKIMLQQFGIQLGKI